MKLDFNSLSPLFEHMRDLFPETEEDIWFNIWNRNTDNVAAFLPVKPCPFLPPGKCMLLWRICQHQISLLAQHKHQFEQTKAEVTLKQLQAFVREFQIKYMGKRKGPMHYEKDPRYKEQSIRDPFLVGVWGIYRDLIKPLLQADVSHVETYLEKTKLRNALEKNANVRVDAYQTLRPLERTILEKVQAANKVPLLLACYDKSKQLELVEWLASNLYNNGDLTSTAKREIISTVKTMLPYLRTTFSVTVGEEKQDEEVFYELDPWVQYI